MACRTVTKTESYQILLDSQHSMDIHVPRSKLEVFFFNMCI